MSERHCHPDLHIAAEIMLADYMRVRAGEQILVTADTGTDMRVYEAIHLAAQRLGAHATMLMSARLPFQGALADPYITPMQAAAILASDVWLDLAFPYFAGSHVHDEAMRAGRCRYLLLGDLDAGGVARLFGGVDLDLYFDAQQSFDAVFQSVPGRLCRIRDEAGTDVSFELDRSTLTKPRHCEAPGMYLVPGACSIAPRVETVRGTIVIGAVFHEFYETLRSPITLILDGKVQSVRGGGAAWHPLERALRRAGGGDYGSVIHFTHGLHPAARFTGRSFIEDMRTVGSNAIGLGVPWWEPGGGENHPDAILAGHSVWVDGQQVIDQGRLIAPQELAQKANKLAPKLTAQPHATEISYASTAITQP